jgi:serine/threonine-protein kinase
MAGLQGRTFGGYELADQLGGGGMAEVYRTRPGRPGARVMAVKVIHPEFAQQPGFRARFDAIVQAATRLNHPHILPLVASGEQAGALYLVFPYVEGGTLRDWLASGKRLGTHDVAPFFRQLCEAASYAHSQGVVHGNIKPGNIFLHEGRHILLGDFGRLWDTSEMDMTHAGPGVEAVAYMAPEATGQSGDQRSDIYSLGAVLFAGLSGRPPFSGNTPFEMLSQHARQPVPRLASAAPSAGPGVSRLDEVIDRAMAKAPEQRYPSALALAQAIEMRVRSDPAARDIVSGPAAPGGAAAPGARPYDGALPPTPAAPGGSSGPVFPPLGVMGAAVGVVGSLGARIGFAPLSGALNVDPGMEQGRVGVVSGNLGGRASGPVGGAGEVAQLPTTALPAQAGAPRVGPPLMVRGVAPGALSAMPELPTQQVPSPNGAFAPGAPARPGSGPVGGPVGSPPLAPAPNSGPRGMYAPPAAPGAPVLNSAPAFGGPYPPAAQTPNAWAQAPLPPAPPATPSPVPSAMPGPPSPPGSNGLSDDWFGIDVEGVPTPLTPSIQPPLSPDSYGSGGLNGSNGYDSYDGTTGSSGWSEDGRPFSPTRLGLPRLSTPELGHMPPSWREIISGPLSPGSSYGDSSNPSDGGSTPGSTPSARYGASYGASRGGSTPSRWDDSAPSDAWTGERGYPSESSQWISQPGHWSGSGEWVSEAREARGGRRRPANGRYESDAYPSARSNPSRWGDSRADSRGYAAGYTDASAAYSAYGPATDEREYDPSRSYSAYRGGGAGRNGSRDDTSYTGAEAAPQRGGRSPRRMPDPYDAFADGGDSDSYGASSAYMPLPASRQERGARVPVPAARRRPPARRLGPVVFCLILLLVGSAGAVVVFRPQICGSRCVSAHNLLMRELSKIGIGHGQPIAAAAPLTTTPAAVTIQVAAGGAATATLTVSNTAASASAWTATSPLAWLTVAPATGTMPASGNGKITLTAKPGASIAPKTYSTTIVFTVNGASLTVPVTITVTAH